MPRFLRQWLAAALLLALSAAAAANDAHVLVLGRISDNPREHYEQLKPLLDYVVPRMRDVGITEGRILMARDARQMASYLRRGRVDWVTETAGTAMRLEHDAGARPLLLTERDGVGAYRTLLFVRRDSGIESLADMRGRSIAFENPSSTSAYYVPVITLLQQGLRLEVLLSPKDRPAPDSVGYVFARSESNIATWVHKRLVDAGAISSLDWDDPRKVPPTFKPDLRIIHRTEAYPRAMEMVRGDLDPTVRERLHQVLIQASGDPDAHEAMLQFFRTTRFVPVDAQVDRSLEFLRKGIRRVNSEIE